MNELYALKGKPDMKIITGVRRSGKSVLLGMFIEELKAIEPEANIVRIDYSDLSFEHLKDAAKLHEFALRSHRKGKANYLFIDEVQDCPGFEKAINSLHKKPEAPKAAPKPSNEELLLTEIRDLLKEK